MTKEKWVRELPTKKGSYWFYGWRFGDKEKEPELSYVEVRKIRNGFIYVLRGHFFDKSKAVGLWCECELPELPRYIY
jgi:hypothetical protein